MILVSRSREPLEAAAEKLAKESGAEVAALAWDVNRTGSLGELVDRAVSIYGGLDVLVNNAGRPGAKAFPGNQPR